MERSGARWVGVLGSAVAVLGLAGASFVNTAAAASGVAASPLALPMSSVATDGDGGSFVANGVTEASSAGFAQPPPASGPYESVRWRPRRDRGWRDPYDRPRERYRDTGSRNDGFSEVHAGFLDPDGAQEAGLVLGYRLGFAVDKNIHLGGQVDWRHHGNSDAAVVSESPGPGGTVITTRQDLARSSSDLVPILGIVQVSAGDMGVIPYLGAGAGYEILHLSAEDFQTGQEFRGTFGGFGWQVWTGVGVPLSSRTQLNAEVFLNRAELSRDTTDPTTGQDIRETVDMDGTGMRFGLQWGF